MIEVTCDFCGEYISVSQASERVQLRGRTLDLHGQCISQIDAFIGDHYRTATAPRKQERNDFHKWRFERERIVPLEATEAKGA